MQANEAQGDGMTVTSTKLYANDMQLTRDR